MAREFRTDRGGGGGRPLVFATRDWPPMCGAPPRTTAAPEVGSVPNGLREETVSSYMKTRKTCEDKICVVCQHDLCDDEDKLISILACGHEYHAGCIKRWLQEKNVCPLCKATVLPEC